MHEEPRKPQKFPPSKVLPQYGIYRFNVRCIHCRHQIDLDNNYDQHLVLFKGHITIEEKIVSKITRANLNKSFSSSSVAASVSLADDYSVIVDGSKHGNFLTHFWRSTGFWCVCKPCV